MYRIPRVNVIESDEGYTVEVLPGRAGGILYTEGERSLVVGSELTITPGIAIFAKSIRSWDPPHHTESIEGEKRAAIVENIRRAFRFDGVEIEVY